MHPLRPLFKFMGDLLSSKDKKKSGDFTVEVSLGMTGTTEDTKAECGLSSSGFPHPETAGRGLETKLAVREMSGSAEHSAVPQIRGGSSLASGRLCRR